MVRPTFSLATALLAVIPVMAIPRHRHGSHHEIHHSGHHQSWHSGNTNTEDTTTMTSSTTNTTTHATTTTWVSTAAATSQHYAGSSSSTVPAAYTVTSQDYDDSTSSTQAADYTVTSQDYDDSTSSTVAAAYTVTSQDYDDSTSTVAAAYTTTGQDYGDSTSSTVAGTSFYASAPTSAASSVPSSFIPGVAFQIVIQDPPVVPPAGSPFAPAEATVWDIDLFQASANRSLVPALKAQGKTVICYFNAGAIQNTDLDLNSWPLQDTTVVGKTLNFGPAGDTFQGENYVNIANPTVVALMQKRVQLGKELGCDGMDPDNVDAWENDGDDPTGFGLTMDDYVSFMSSLSATARGAGMMIGLKNAPEIAETLHGTVDFAILESCLADGDESQAFCEMYQDYIAGGKPVFDIAYPSSGGTSNGVDETDYQLYCDTVNGNQGFGKVLKLDGNTNGLNGWTQYCNGQGAIEAPCGQTQ